MRTTRTDDTPAEAFLSTAREYHLAAKALLPLYEKVPSPVYFVFSHVIELALKAYLRSYRLSVPRGWQGHNLRQLLERCSKSGLRVTQDLLDIVQILDYENGRHGFRYFLFESTGRPEINYLRDAVDGLMRIVEEEVRMRPNTDPSGAVLKVIVGRPEEK
jgi:HEPN domain-containing protein